MSPPKFTKQHSSLLGAFIQDIDDAQQFINHGDDINEAFTPEDELD